ncbi:unnamed protein product [Oikopleura dioica]|uniref:Uncharacterized protein n=2 Tax=Oikopleura dioica TaxID=34765 RepID=E4XE85_OIKDI|nr:unnamed protein product [Oikopleura dioica]
MGHAQSKRKKRSQARLRRKIEHVTHEQTRAGASGNARLPDRKSVQKSARWREPSPEKLETLERRKRDAANRTKRSRSRSEQSRSRSPKRQSRANLTESNSNLNAPQMQPYQRVKNAPTCSSREYLKIRNPETTRGRNFSRRSGTWFCVVRCRSEPPFDRDKAARVHHLPPRKSASSSPARRVRRELESTPMYQNGLQVEPKLLRLFGSSAKSGPIPQTNRVAPRALRRSFPNLASHASRKDPQELAPKRNFISRTAKDKSGAFCNYFSRSLFSVRIASSKTGSSAFPETTNSATEAKTLRPRTFSPAIIVRDRTCFHQLTKILRPKLTNNANQHTNRNNQNNYGSVETLSSFSSQSGSYHLPSSANFSTLPDRSLAESPHALHIDSDLEKYSEESEDELYIRTIPQTPPLTVPVAYASNDEPPSSPETGKKNLLWSNPAPFGSQPLQKVIRSVQAPIQKPQNLHWPPLERKKPDSSNRTPPRPPPLPLRPPQLTHQLEKQVLDVQEISVLPLRLSPRERPRSAVQDRVYKDILFDNTERTSSPIKSGLSKTLRPSIEDLVSILAEPIPPHNRKSHRRSLHEQSEEILINELKTEKKPRPGILKNSNTTSSSRVVEVLYHEPRSRKTDQERMRRAEHPPIFLGEDDFGNNWIDLTQPARTPYLNDY